MNILASILLGWLPSSTPNPESASAFFDSIPMYSTMYINGTDLQKEIKRTPRGVFIREVNEKATVIHQQNINGQKEIRIRSKAQWTMVEHPEVLVAWFQEMDEVNGDRSRCNFQGNAYVLSMDGYFLSVADDTCIWSGALSLNQLVYPGLNEVGSDRYFADLGETISTRD